MYIGHDAAGGSGRAAIVRPAGERTKAAKEDRGLPRPRGGQGAWDLPEWVLGVCSPATWRRASSGPCRGASRGRGGATPAPSFPSTNFSLDNQSERGRGHNTDRSI